MGVHMNRRDFLRLLGIGTTSTFVFGSGVWRPRTGGIEVAQFFSGPTRFPRDAVWDLGDRVGNWVWLDFQGSKTMLSGFYRISDYRELILRTIRRPALHPLPHSTTAVN